MKKYIIAALLLSVTGSLFAAETTIRRIPQKKVIHIDVSAEEHFDEKEYSRYMRRSKYDYKAHNYANRKLRRRIRQLELAVKQLQDEIYWLRDQRTTQRSGFACALNAGTRGMYLGKASTKVEAKAIAFQKCAQKKGDFWCEGQPMTCERELAH